MRYQIREFRFQVESIPDLDSQTCSYFVLILFVGREAVQSAVRTGGGGVQETHPGHG
jgi:hypothetical protein